MMKLTENVYYVGVSDRDTKTFDIIMETPFGTTYNAYLVRGEKTALIDTVHDKFCSEYLDRISEILPISEIDYLICNHIEPDHSGCIERIIDINPDITIVATVAALRNLKMITNKPFAEMLAKESGELDLGSGTVLKFIITPNLHWPDTMMTWQKGDGVLFSCDAMGAHYVSSSVTDETLENDRDYKEAREHYYECIMSPFAPFVRSAVNRIKSLDIRLLCPGHGPVIKERITDILEYYSMRSEQNKTDKKKVSVIYASAYGYTEELSRIISDKINSLGVECEILDIAENDAKDVIGMIAESDAVLIGTPTINRTAPKAVWDIVTSIDTVSSREKLYGVFGSYGWSGEACGLVHNFLSGLKFRMFDEQLRVIFKPFDEDIKNTEEYAERFVRQLIG